MTAVTSLDPTNPLVLDTRPLGRRAGAMRAVERTFPAPGDWAVTSCRVAAGAPAELRVRLEAVVEGVLVSGTATLATEAECSRCLDPIRGLLAVQVQQLFEYADIATPRDDDTEPLPALHGELLDLEPTLRDAVVLDLPLVPLCSPDCPGLCATCGARLADDPGHHHDEQDSRWAGLHDWLARTDEVPAPVHGTHETDEKGN